VARDKIRVPYRYNTATSSRLSAAAAWHLRGAKAWHFAQRAAGRARYLLRREVPELGTGEGRACLISMICYAAFRRVSCIISPHL